MMTMKYLFALSFGFAALILAVQSGHAAPPCAPRAAVTAQLADRYGEVRRGIGLAGEAAVVELFVSGRGSWTVTVTLPDGRMCLLASGLGWEAVQDALPAGGDPA